VPRNLGHWFFLISVIAKGVDGVLEVIGGVLLLVVSPAQLYGIAKVLTQHELMQDPSDAVANYVLHSTQNLSADAKTFGAVYLLWHGIVKVLLVAALLQRRRWAYPLAIGAFLLFLLYQLYRYSHTQAPELLVLSVLDVFVIVLTWLEYRRLRSFSGFAP
jgi:uncharacterized membrane protein